MFFRLISLLIPKLLLNNMEVPYSITEIPQITLVIKNGLEQEKLRIKFDIVFVCIRFSEHELQKDYGNTLDVAIGVVRKCHEELSKTVKGPKLRVCECPMSCTSNCLSVYQ